MKQQQWKRLNEVECWKMSPSCVACAGGASHTVLTPFPLQSLPRTVCNRAGSRGYFQWTDSHSRGIRAAQDKPSCSPDTSHAHECHRPVPWLPHQLYMNTLPNPLGGTQDHPPRTKAPAAGHRGVFTAAAPYPQSHPAAPTVSG